VVNECEAPKLLWEVNPDDSNEIFIYMEESGEVRSGIGEIQVWSDGEKVLLDEYKSVETGLLSTGKNVVVLAEGILRLPIGDHEIEVAVSDNAGNIAMETFAVEIRPDDLINVVLPTTFYLGIQPYGEGDRQIYSEDIVVENKSDFPIDVDVRSVDVWVNKEIPEDAIRTGAMETGTDTVYDLTSVEKTCNLNMYSEWGEEERNYDLQEGANTGFDEMVVETNSSATISFSGSLGENSATLWRDGDLRITVLFTFAKHESEEEAASGQEEKTQENTRT
jgi:hypothetical protein